MFHNIIIMFPGVYLSLNGDIIPNHGYVVISDIGSTDNTALLCHTNHPATFGGGSNSGGDWFAPDGTRFSGLDIPGFVRNRSPMLVILQRRNDGTPEHGIYHCEVENADNIIQTLYVGLYNNRGGKMGSYFTGLFNLIAEINVFSQ